MTASWTAGQTVQLLNSKEADLKYLLPAFARSNALLWMRAIPHPLLIFDTNWAGKHENAAGRSESSLGFPPATFSLRSKERCEALSAATPDRRDVLSKFQSKEGLGDSESSGRSNKYLSFCYEE